MHAYAWVSEARSYTRVYPHTRTSTLDVLSHPHMYNLEWARKALPCERPWGPGPGPQRRRPTKQVRGHSPVAGGAPGSCQQPEPPGPPFPSCAPPGHLRGKRTDDTVPSPSAKRSPERAVRRSQHIRCFTALSRCPLLSQSSLPPLGAKECDSLPFPEGKAEAGPGPSRPARSFSQRKRSSLHRLRNCHTAPGFDL